MTNTDTMYVLNSNCGSPKLFRTICQLWTYETKWRPENNKIIQILKFHTIVKVVQAYSNPKESNRTIFHGFQILQLGSFSKNFFTISEDFAIVSLLSNKSKHLIPDVLWIMLICSFKTRLAPILFISLKWRLRSVLSVWAKNCRPMSVAFPPSMIE